MCRIDGVYLQVVLIADVKAVERDAFAESDVRDKLVVALEGIAVEGDTHSIVE
jgi:hypothetical protein